MNCFSATCIRQPTWVVHVEYDDIGVIDSFYCDEDIHYFFENVRHRRPVTIEKLPDYY